MKSARGNSIGKEELVVTKNCARFNPYHKNVNNNSAVIYLRLRNEGCDKKKAITFSSKNYCRTDTTKALDGPLDYRKLKVKKDSVVIATNGWKADAPYFDMGKDYALSARDFVHDDAQSRYFEQHFGKHESKIKEDYKKKIASLRDYFEEINSNCNFTRLSKEELYSKLKRENAQLKRHTKWKKLELGRTYGFDSNWIETSDLRQNNHINVMDALSYDYSPISDGKGLGSLLKFPSSNSRTKLDPTPRNNRSLRKHSTAGSQDLDKGIFKLMGVEPPVEPKTVETIKIEESSGEEDDEEEEEKDKDYQKAYEELGNQTNVLFQMAHELPDHVSTEELIAKKKKKKNIVSLGKIKESGTKKITKKTEIANEFNKINYFYIFHNEEDVLPSDSPARRAKVKEEQKHRKEQLRIEKKLFENIIKKQIQENNIDLTHIETKNLEHLRAKQDGIRHSIQRKIGLGPDYSTHLPSDRDFRGSVSARSNYSKDNRDSVRNTKDISLLSTSSRSILSPTSRSDRSRKDFIITTPRNNNKKVQFSQPQETLKKISGGSRLIPHPPNLKSQFSYHEKSSLL